MDSYIALRDNAESFFDYRINICLVPSSNHQSQVVGLGIYIYLARYIWKIVLNFQSRIKRAIFEKLKSP